MRLFIDTNIFLEVILAQDRAAEAQALLARTEEHTFFMSDYCLSGCSVFRGNNAA